MLICPASWGFSSVALVARGFRPKQTKKHKNIVQDREKCETFIDMDPWQKTGFLYQFRRFQDYLRRKLHIERKIKILKKPISLEDATQSSNNEPCSSSQSSVLSTARLKCEQCRLDKSQKATEKTDNGYGTCQSLPSGNSRGRSWYRNHPPGRLKLLIQKLKWLGLDRP